MTQQQQIVAINALAACLHWKLNGKQWRECSAQEQESLRHVTVQALRTLNEDGHLNAQDVFEFLVFTSTWKDASAEMRVLCENAVKAMKEVLESEKEGKNE